ncbi:transcription factor E2F6 [Mastacembelus armatus]|uniref:Uncharacterized LOC113137527 n=1 Tax=Mastacembelus armatus TaxID=205130 RepID=A0A3Q3N1G9_9TELE|nr:transcription factor E2F6-like [Mastacembelus armatus]
MVKCIVSGCPNRVVNVHRGIFNRPPKRFFNFPKDPTRVKVWLAALRETDKHDSTEQHLICEDHFLPEDISNNEVNSDAIPIMPPCPDGPMGIINPWGAESSEEEDHWATGGDEEEDESVDDVGHAVPAAVDPPAPQCPAVELLKQDPCDKMSSAVTMSSASLHQTKETVRARRPGNRQDVSLGMLTRRFLELLLIAPDGSVDLGQVTTSLQTRRRRVYDITNVLDAISLIEKESASRIKWIGKSPISSFLWKNQEKFQREMENLKLVEDTLDTFIKGCAQQLFDMTDDLENAAMAYVTYEDIGRLEAFQEQTVIVVKAPEETKLEIPAPTENSIQVHLKAERGPIMVLTCDIGAGEAVSEEEKSSCFLTLEESRITRTTLHKEASSSQTA